MLSACCPAWRAPAIATDRISPIMDTLCAIRDAAPSSVLSYEWVGQDCRKWKRAKQDESGQVVEL